MGLNPHQKQAQSLIQKWLNEGYTDLTFDEDGRGIPVKRQDLVPLRHNEAEELLEESIADGQEYS